MQKPTAAVAILKDPERLPTACFGNVIIATCGLTPPVVLEALRPFDDVQRIHPVQLITSLADGLRCGQQPKWAVAC